MTSQSKSFRHFIIATTFASLALFGCVPIKMIKQPGIEGAVFDAKTQQPVAGAVIELNGPFKSLNSDSFYSTAKTESEQIVTDQNGKFSLTVIYFTWWKPLYIPSEPTRDNFTVTIDRPGYRQWRSLLSDGSPIYNLGGIELQPAGEKK
jgi:hypothetical protein